VPFRKMKDTLLANDSLAGLYRFAVDNFINGLIQATPTEGHPSAPSSDPVAGPSHGRRDHD